jgi:hypothetical protein
VQQENLLPDTKAITRGTIEMHEYRGKWLVRYKDLDGNVYRDTYETADVGFPVFLKYVDQCRAACREHNLSKIATQEW